MTRRIVALVALLTVMAAAIGLPMARAMPRSAATMEGCWICVLYFEPISGQRWWTCASAGSGGNLCIAAVDGSSCGVNGICPP